MANTTTFWFRLLHGILLSGLGFSLLVAQTGSEPYYLDDFHYQGGFHEFPVQDNLLQTDQGLTLDRVDRETRIESETILIQQKVGGSFVAVAPEVTWNQPAQANLEVFIRFGYPNGNWDNWTPVRESHQGLKGPGRWIGNLLVAPDGVSRYRYAFKFSQPNVQPPFATIERLDVHVVSLDNSLSTTPLPTSRQHQLIYATDSITPYIDRDNWAAPITHPRFGDPDCDPRYDTLTHFVLHHSLTANQSHDWPATVQALWYYDVYVLERCDMRFNWLIDPEGTLYEGREGGYRVVADHLQCHSAARTLGVCMIGTYIEEDPTPQAISTLRQLLRWQKDNAGFASMEPTLLYHAEKILPRITTEDAICETNNPPLRLSGIIPSLSDLVSGMDLRNSAEMSIFPNPTSGTLHVKLDSRYTQQATLSVLNQRGQVVHRQAWSLFSGANATSLQLGHLPLGLYYVQLQTDQQVVAHKVLVEK